MIRRLLWLLAFLLPAPALALEPVTLQLNWKHQFQFAGYYAAIEKGYYREAGFNVRLAEVENGIDPIDSVLAGRAQFGVGASELVLRRGQGQPLVALAVIFQHSPLVLLARKDTVAGSIHDLAGKRVMLMPHETELYAYLQREGLGRAAIQVIPQTFDTADLISGRVDAMSGYQTDEPFTLSQAKLDYAIFTPRSSGVDFYGDTLFASEALVRAKPEMVRAFRLASLRGWQYAMAHPEEIADLILTKYGRRHSRAHLLFEAAELAHLMQPDLVEIGHMSMGRWQHIVDTYAELGMLPRDTALDGFLYEASAASLPGWILPAFLAGGALFALMTGVALRFARLSRQLRTESAARQDLLQQLRAVQRDKAALIDATPGAAMLLDREGTILTMNSTGARRFGGGKDDVTGRNIFEISPPDIRIGRRQATEQAALERRVVTIEDRRAGRDLRNTIVPVEDEDGEVRRVAVFSEDVTERVQAELALKKREERYRMLMETAPFPVVLTRVADNTVVYINRRAAQRFGVPQEKAIGLRAQDYWQDPADREHLVSLLRDQGAVTDLEVRLKDGNGEPFWAYLSAVLTRQDDELLAFVSFNDITERKAAEESMRDAHDRLQLQIAEIQQLQARLAEMAIRDGLTGLFNRRYMDETLEREISRARREGYPLSLVMIDIDHFKRINDTYGHQAGDEVLRAWAQLLRADVRTEDVPCRYGGEEFLVLLPRMPVAAAAERAEAWRAAFEAQDVTFGNFSLRSTASFGVAGYPQHGKDADELTQCADLALYLAKRDGRNRVTIFTADELAPET